MQLDNTNFHLWPKKYKFAFVMGELNIKTPLLSIPLIFLFLPMLTATKTTGFQG